MADKTVRKTITRVTRCKRLSMNGNPSYEVGFEDGTSAKTITDGSIGYEIDNREWMGATVDATFRADGRLVYVKHTS
jgi:hypothetical protein